MGLTSDRAILAAMWSDRPPPEGVRAQQLGSAPCDEERYQAFVDAVTTRARAPFEGPDPECSVPRFGVPARAVRLQHQQGQLVLRSVHRDVQVANETLSEFMGSIGDPAAAEVGLTIALSPAEVPVPVAERRRWLRLPGGGTFEPCYRTYVPPGGEPNVRFDCWMSEPIALRCMGDHEVRFRVWNPPEEAELELLGAAVANLCAAGPELLESATEHVFRYYSDIVEFFDAEEREAYGIPEIESPSEVWQHVQLGRTPGVSTTVGNGSEYLHRDVAYVKFECECAWEREHGLCLVFIDGERLGRVSSYDGHPTWAHAYADASLLDVIYHPRS